MFCINHKQEKPSYGRNVFYDMKFGGFNLFVPPNELRTKDYGVPFKDIIDALNEGLF